MNGWIAISPVCLSCLLLCLIPLSCDISVFTLSHPSEVQCFRPFLSLKKEWFVFQFSQRNGRVIPFLQPAYPDQLFESHEKHPNHPFRCPSVHLILDSSRKLHISSNGRAPKSGGGNGGGTALPNASVSSWSWSFWEWSRQSWLWNMLDQDEEEEEREEKEPFIPFLSLGFIYSTDLDCMACSRWIVFFFFLDALWMYERQMKPSMRWCHATARDHPSTRASKANEQTDRPLEASNVRMPWYNTAETEDGNQRKTSNNEWREIL